MYGGIKWLVRLVRLVGAYPLGRLVQLGPGDRSQPLVLNVVFVSSGSDFLVGVV